jgi:hypothetical protein
MSLLFAGLAGVVIGASIASCIFIYVYQKRADRDLVERRLRACFEYRECLGDLERVFETAGGEAKVIDQAWHNVAAFCREFRKTGWLFGPEAHAHLEGVVEALERAGRAHSSNGKTTGARGAQLLCEKCREVDAVLRREIGEQVREHRKQRYLPG